MKKIVIFLVVLIVLIVFCFCFFGINTKKSNSNNDEVISEVNDINKSQNELNNSSDEKDYIDDLTHIEKGKAFSNYKEAYLELLNNLNNYKKTNKVKKYDSINLIYIDDDDIPELCLYTKFEDGSDDIRIYKLKDGVFSVIFKEAPISSFVNYRYFEKASKMYALKIKDRSESYYYMFEYDQETNSIKPTINLYSFQTERAIIHDDDSKEEITKEQFNEYMNGDNKTKSMFLIGTVDSLIEKLSE